jgi:dTDP-glucose 4,6-dehydratase
MREDSNGAPDDFATNTAYGQGKYLAENLCHDYYNQHGLEAVIARCYTFVGPYMSLDAQFAMGNFLGQALRQEPLITQGDGRDSRSYLYAADLTFWLWTLLFQGTPAYPYNVGSEEAITIAELAQTVVSTLALELPVEIRQQPLPDKAPSLYIPCTQRVRKELGLRAHTSLEAAILKTAIWFQSFQQTQDKPAPSGVQ